MHWAYYTLMRLPLWVWFLEQSGRPADRARDQIRVRHQPENRTGTRTCDPAHPPCPRRRGDRMRSLSARVIALMVIFAIGDPTAAQTVNRITVGLLSLHSSDHEKAGRIGASAFRAGMQALGYSEGRNFHLHERHADGDVARLPSLAAELLAERVDVIVAVGTDATHAAREVHRASPSSWRVSVIQFAQASSSACHIQ